MTFPTNSGASYLSIPLHSPRYRRLMAWMGVLFGALPLLASIPYYFLVRMFLPAPMFGAGIVPVAVVWGLVGLGVFLPMALAGEGLSWAQRLLLLFLGPVFAAAIGVMAWLGPVPYLLHVASESLDGQTSVTVRSLSDNASGRGACGNRVEFSSGVGPFPHFICGVPDALFGTLNVGGTVLIEGRTSRFGTLGHGLKVPDAG